MIPKWPQIRKFLTNARHEWSDQLVSLIPSLPLGAVAYYKVTLERIIDTREKEKRHSLISEKPYSKKTTFMLFNNFRKHSFLVAGLARFVRRGVYTEKNEQQMKSERGK